MTDRTAITYVRDLDGCGNPRLDHARRAAAGRDVRIAWGAYIEGQLWHRLNDRERYLVRIRAVAETRRHGMVLSHWSAAAIHGLPVMGAWPLEVHFTIGRVSGGRSRRMVVKHAYNVPPEDVVDVDGLTVTSLARTVLDLAVAADALTSTMVIDRALLVDRFDRVRPLLEREQLWNAFERRGSFRAAARAAARIEFGETAAESPLESVSRANMRIIGCPLPELQARFVDSRGFIGNADFYWRALRLVGEADGKEKYLNAQLRNGRSAAAVVVDEKLREDRIRAIGERVSRWPWEIGVNPTRLRTHLRAAGVPIR